MAVNTTIASGSTLTLTGVTVVGLSAGIVSFEELFLVNSGTGARLYSTMSPSIQDVVFTAPGNVITTGNLTDITAVGNLTTLSTESLVANSANASATIKIQGWVGEPTGFGALYFCQTTPDANNYAFLGSAGITFFNATTNIYFRINNGSNVMEVDSSQIIFFNPIKYSYGNTTGDGTALLGTNSPAVTNTAPYTWITITTSDDSTGYIPVWK